MAPHLRMAAHGPRAVLVPQPEGVAAAVELGIQEDGGQMQWFTVPSLDYFSWPPRAGEQNNPLGMVPIPWLRDPLEDAPHLVPPQMWRTDREVEYGTACARLGMVETPAGPLQSAALAAYAAGLAGRPRGDEPALSRTLAADDDYAGDLVEAVFHLLGGPHSCSRCRRRCSLRSPHKPAR